MHPRTFSLAPRGGLARLAHRGIFVAVVAGVGVACAPVIGLDSLDPVDCVDCTDDSGAAADSAASPSVEAGTKLTSDAGMVVDANHDGSADGANLRHPDSGTGADSGGSATDGAAVCGLTCDSTSASSSSCSAGTCSYTCKAGRADCNQTAPNLDGCECATTGCCGSGCETVHQNGLGETWFDCAPLNTFTKTSAMSACEAETGSAGACGTQTCPGSVSVICSTGSLTTCACWAYSGSTAGRVAFTTGLLTCGCPTTTSPTWN